MYQVDELTRWRSSACATGPKKRMRRSLTLVLRLRAISIDHAAAPKVAAAAMSQPRPGSKRMSARANAPEATWKTLRAWFDGRAVTGPP
jgi:hypothetical protein